MSTPRKVVVADRNEGRAKQLRSLLIAQGWQIFLAPDAVSATAAALRQRPDAVVLSQSLAGGGGLVTLRRIRASVHTAAIPVIAIADDGEDSVNELRREGADECLPAQAQGAAVIASLQKFFGEPVQVMEAPPSIIRQPDRLASLDRTGLLDSPPTEPFDILTRLAATLLSVPVALVSLVDRERQFFKSSIGLPEPWASTRETPLTHSFCQWVVSDHAALVVADARNHAVLRHNRALHEISVVAYAGIPLTANSGEAIGSFCAVDSKPHHWSEKEMEVLRELACVADALIALSEFDAQQDASKPATEMDQIVQSLTTRAIGRGMSAAAGILRREEPLLVEPARRDLLRLLQELGQQLVRVQERDYASSPNDPLQGSAPLAAVDAGRSAAVEKSATWNH